ncbi:MAG: DUF87 domain-containing protein [Ilumatobacteraceae bacterium]|nr:DUF87 domain-containing protein [Ilumatobacteraceae bacterium]
MKPTSLVTTTAGPDSGVALRGSLPVTIGSSPQSAGYIDDPTLESQHFVIGGNGSVIALQSVSETCESDGVVYIEAGSTRFVVEREGDSTLRPQRRRQVNPVIRTRRQISTAPVVESQDLPSPPSPLRMTTFAMPVMSIATASLIALLTHSWMYLVFGAGAALMGLTSAASEISRYRRDKNQHDEAVASSELKFHIQHTALSEFKKNELRSRWPLDIENWLRSERLWEIRPDHDDFLSCVVGTHVMNSSETVTGDPVFVKLPTHKVVVVQGERHMSESLIRQIVAQVCLRSGPADVCIEANGVCEVPATYTERQDDQSRYMIVLTDDIQGLGTATSELRQRLAADDRVTIVALAAATQQIPSCVEVVIRLNVNWHGEVVADDGITLAHMAGISIQRWHQWSAQLLQLDDPERVQSSVEVLPQRVRLREFARQPDRSLSVELGETITGPFEINLVDDGPHVLIAGTTGSGKSEFLRTLITSLCIRYSSEALNLVLIDFKGGSTFDEFNKLPHVADVVSDLDVEQIERMLNGLQIEIHRREQMLREMNIRDIASLPLNERSLSRLVIIVDEFAVLAHRYPEHMKTFVAIASQGRSLGLHLVLASQRVSGAITDDIRANTDLRIAFRVADAAESRDVVGCTDAAHFSKAHPGRALVVGSGGDVVVVQTAAVTKDDLDELEHLCEVYNDALARRPWSDALPEKLAPSAEGVGLIDVPEHQAHIDWAWTPRSGSLSIEGGFGSGTTTALMSVLFHHSAVPAYVIDARGDDALLRINEFPHVAPVVFAWDQEQRTRILRVINTHLVDRKKSGERSPLVIAVDGISELIRQFNDRELDILRALCREGEGVGISLITTGAEPPVPATTRVVLGCTGGRAVMANGVVPGRGTLYCHGDRPREIQIRPTTDVPVGHCIAPPTIEKSPDRIDWLTGGGERRGSSTILDIGIAVDDLSTGTCEIRDGRHLLVIGPSGSGRTTSLHTIMNSWQHARGGVITIATGRTIGDVPIVDSPHLVVVDDADHVFGAEDLLRRLHDEEDITVVAAVDPLSLRISFDHWTQQLRKSQTALLMTECASADSDLVYPGRLPTQSIDPRPGLAWVISGGATTLVQIAAMLGECQLSQIPSISSDLTTPLWSLPEHQLA